TRSLVANMIEGVVNGYKKQLEIVGVGWNAAVKGKTVELNVGYADTRKVPVPDGVLVEVKGQDITVTGPDKQLVGQTAAAIRAHKKPEPYNGKGIKYKDEVILRKAGKAFAGGGK
ncbi:MAG: 50S ribosomal protein L6, partial [Planctomycetota bacterium]